MGRRTKQPQREAAFRPWESAKRRQRAAPMSFRSGTKAAGQTRMRPMRKGGKVWCSCRPPLRRPPRRRRRPGQRRLRPSRPWARRRAWSARGKGKARTCAGACSAACCACWQWRRWRRRGPRALPAPPRGQHGRICGGGRPSGCRWMRACGIRRRRAPGGGKVPSRGCGAKGAARPLSLLLLPSLSSSLSSSPSEGQEQGQEAH